MVEVCHGRGVPSPRCAMVVARCAVTPPHQSRPRRGACTFITLKARGLEFFQKTRNDVACSTNKRLELEQSDLAVVGNRPRLGVHVHPVVGGGHDTPGQGARAHPASASSCGGGHGTPGQGARTHPASASSYGGGCAPRGAMVEVCQVRGVPWSRCAKPEVCHGRGVPSPRCAMVMSCAPRCAMAMSRQVRGRCGPFGVFPVCLGTDGRRALAEGSHVLPCRPAAARRTTLARVTGGPDAGASAAPTLAMNVRGRAAL